MAARGFRWRLFSGGAVLGFGAEAQSRDLRANALEHSVTRSYCNQLHRERQRCVVPAVRQLLRRCASLKLSELPYDHGYPMGEAAVLRVRDPVRVRDGGWLSIALPGRGPPRARGRAPSSSHPPATRRGSRGF